MKNYLCVLDTVHLGSPASDVVRLNDWSGTRDSAARYLLEELGVARGWAPDSAQVVRFDWVEVDTPRVVYAVTGSVRSRATGVVYDVRGTTAMATDPDEAWAGMFSSTARELGCDLRDLCVISADVRVTS